MNKTYDQGKSMAALRQVSEHRSSRQAAPRVHAVGFVGQLRISLRNSSQLPAPFLTKFEGLLRSRKTFEHNLFFFLFKMIYSFLCFKWSAPSFKWLVGNMSPNENPIMLFHNFWLEWVQHWAQNDINLKRKKKIGCNELWKDSTSGKNNTERHLI